MLFFQFALLLGYCYSHFVARHLTSKQQWILHAALLAMALFFLPVQPSDTWKPAGTEDPTWRMLLLLTASIGFPFFLLSTTGPLIQSWQSRTHPSKSAYRLFAVSNFGSLLGLLGYPFLVEPYLRLGNQSLFWSIGFGLFAILSLWSGWQLFGAPTKETDAPTDKLLNEQSDSQLSNADPAPSIRNGIVWTLLAFVPSAMLLATTNQMCQEVASVPFLWVLPLALYLLTFIICFENPRWYKRAFFFPLLFVATLIALGLMQGGTAVPLPLQVAGYALVMFACCLSCHGELARAKPAEKDLTLFYLMVSVGGALGGIFVVIIAPRIFEAYFEFHVSLALCLSLSVISFLVFRYSGAQTKQPAGANSYSNLSWYMMLNWTTILISMILLGLLATKAIKEQMTLNKKSIVYRTRNSYGTLFVREYSNNGVPTVRHLVNGRIKHGSQLAAPQFKNSPTSYYSPSSAIGVAIGQLRILNKSDGSNPTGLRVGVVGLGTGTIAAWGETGDSFKFYEINPAVELVARKYFSYLSGSRAKEDIEVSIGDARIQIERHLAEIGSEEFDLLAIDAFSSDAIPMHLLTRECFGLYLDNLSDKGILAIHVSNRYLNLGTIVHNLSNEANYSSFLISNDKDNSNSTDAASWVLVLSNQKLVGMIEQEGKHTPWPESMPATVWTDDFGSLTEVMDFSKTTKFARKKWEIFLNWIKQSNEDDTQD